MRWSCIALAAIAVVLAVGHPQGPAQAQDEPIVVAQRENPISTLFRQLFRPLQPRRPPPAQVAPSQRQPAAQPQRQRQRQPRAAAPAAQPQRPAAVEKDPDARQVVVFGDFFASGLGRGLEDAFIETSSVAVSSRTNASSGLVRDDHFDWPAAIRRFLDDPDRRIDVAVIMIGGNDHQPLRAERQEHAPRSDGWRELYTARVDQMIQLFHEQGIPVFWVGLPPVQSQRLNQGYALFNDIYRERAHRAGAGFVDVWNGFVDEDGNFAMHGPDLSGERRRLRNDDGLTFTAAGNRKLAHFVARDIRRDIGTDGEFVAALPAGPAGPQPFAPAEEEQETGIGEIMTLTGAPPQAMGLAGGPDPTPEPPDDSAYYRTIILGETPEPQPGRADDFSWPREPEGASPADGAS